MFLPKTLVNTRDIVCETAYSANVALLLSVSLFEETASGGFQMYEFLNSFAKVSILYVKKELAISVERLVFE